MIEASVRERAKTTRERAETPITRSGQAHDQRLGAKPDILRR
jgi:hypothetical protein